MRTLADIKRRLVPGVRLEVLAHDVHPASVGTIRELIDGKTSLRFRVFEPDGSEREVGGRGWFMDLPKAADVTIIDADTWEYRINRRLAPPDTIRLRFLP